MKKVGDIFEDARLKARPYSTPEGYFESVESRVSEKIGKHEGRGGAWAVLKPAALLVCSFAFVLFMGYGVMALTDTKSSKTALSEAHNSEQPEEITIEDDEIVEYLAQTLSLEQIHEFLSSESANSNQ